LNPVQLAFRWAYGSTLGSPTWRLVLFVIALNSKPVKPGQVVCDFSLEEIAQHAELSRNGAWRVVKALAAAGVIRVVNRQPEPSLIYLAYDGPQPNLTAGSAG